MTGRGGMSTGRRGSGRVPQHGNAPQHDDDEQGQHSVELGAAAGPLDDTRTPLQAAERSYVLLEEEYQSLHAAAPLEKKEELSTKYQPMLERAFERLQRAAQLQQQQQQDFWTGWQFKSWGRWLAFLAAASGATLSLTGLFDNKVAKAFVVISYCFCICCTFCSVFKY